MTDLLTPFEYEYMLKAILVSGLIGGVCAFLSCFNTLKGWSLMGDALSHAVLQITAGAGGTIWTGGPVASSPVTITGFTPVTGYTVYVREVCPGPDYSPNSFATNFTTPCATYTPDYTQDFTAYVPSCW